MYGHRISLTFEKIEVIIGTRLDASARKHRQWWENEVRDSHTHVAEWRAAGQRTEEVSLIGALPAFADGHMAGSAPIRTQGAARPVPAAVSP